MPYGSLRRPWPDATALPSHRDPVEAPRNLRRLREKRGSTSLLMEDCWEKTKISLENIYLKHTKNQWIWMSKFIRTSKVYVVKGPNGFVTETLIQVSQEHFWRTDIAWLSLEVLLRTSAPPLLLDVFQSISRCQNIRSFEDASLKCIEFIFTSLFTLLLLVTHVLQLL